jgi:hypothetical protein
VPCDIKELNDELLRVTATQTSIPHLEGFYGRCIWEDNIKLDLTEMGREDVGWMHMAQDGDQWWALVNTVLNLRVP